MPTEFAREDVGVAAPPLVSVVVPVYNVEGYLRTCVGSLLDQTHDNLQIILVNDGSTDASGHLCDELGRSDQRIVVVHRKNGGLSAARNSGLRRVMGEFVLFLDSDDWVELDAVARLVRAAQHESADVVVCGYYLDVHDGHDLVDTSTPRVPVAMVVAGSLEDPKQANRETLGFAGYAWNKLYRRELIEGSVFPEGISLVEEIIFNGPVLGRANRVVFVGEPLVHYIQRPRVTLGTGFQPQFGSLLVKASQSVRELFLSWSVPSDQVERTVLEAAYGRIQWALRGLVIHGDLDARTRRAQMRALLQDPRVRSILVDAINGGLPSNPMKRLLVRSQARGFTWPTYVTYTLRGKR